MYSREINSAPEKIIQNGKPVFGTFNSLPKKLDIKGVSAPFGGIPLPPILSRLRIRARAFYAFFAGDYFGTVDFFDNKLLSITEFSLWNTKSGVKYVYNNFLGVRRKLVPVNLERAQCLSPSVARHLRLSWNHLANRLSLKVNVHGLRHRPEINLMLAGRFSDENSSEIISVKPAPSSNRCSATWCAATPVKGRLEIKGAENAALGLQGGSILFVNRAYYKFITHGESLTGTGFAGGRFVSFRFWTTNFDSFDGDKYNDNTLFCDGKFTPMPPVCLTHPFGLEKNWIIQDFESMVDLEFTPQNSYSRNNNFIIIKKDCYTVFGFLNGTLLDSEGNKIELNNFPAVAKRSVIRL